MPKEIVLEDQSRFVTPDEDAEGLVQVSWDPHPIGHVQIATFQRAKETHETVWDGFYVDLDRVGINRLIRNLRKARDSAYGRDE